MTAAGLSDAAAARIAARVHTNADADAASSARGEPRPVAPLFARLTLSRARASHEGSVQRLRRTSDSLYILGVIAQGESRSRSNRDARRPEFA